MIVFEKETSSNACKISIIGEILFNYREDLKKRLQERPEINSIYYKEKCYYLKRVSYIKEDNKELIYVLNYDKD